MDIKVKIGKRIEELRKDRKLSQEKLAAEAGIDRTYVNSVEKGRRNISVVNIEKIVKALGTSLKDFFASELFKEK